MTVQPVDIIVVTYNRINYLKSFIEFLYLFTDYPFRVIVVDNGSIDGSRELVLKLEQENLVWKHVFNTKNLPLAAAFSEGFKCVESDLFVTVADDMTPAWKKPCWLTVFVSKMKSDDSIGSINFLASRRSYESFNSRTRNNIYNKILRDGGEKAELLERLHNIL